GPDVWQAEQLIRIGEKFKENPLCSLREATASGHGIGKSAEVAFIVLWAMSTRPHLNGVVTANTLPQLTTKTWRELAVWHKRAINEHWFKWSATKFYHRQHPETWFVAAVPNTEHNSEAFAGLHATHVLVIYDEASGIPDKIWEVSEGAMTTPRAMWFVYGNPTRNTGRFRECFYSDKSRWVRRQIDSRTARMTNKEEISSWVEVYGEDSDFIRVRVRGVFPRVGDMQFIASDLVDRAMHWECPYEAHFQLPVLIGVDVARYGDDKTIIAIRQGRKLLELRKFRELNTMQVATQVADAIREFRPAAVFVDGIGVGAGVVDRLRMLSYEIVEVNAGVKADDFETYFNKRAEMWDRMRIWLREGADLPNDAELRQSLIGIEYAFDAKELMRMERKQDMKKRGLESPDEGDGIAMTFAEAIGDYTNNFFEPDDSFEPEDMAA
ncbi:MAG TPA: terminase, partial [Burkholderiales bacterium]|nr:terminase [Burkholderiales bacterium]